jgi:hypothetical protein
MCQERHLEALFCIRLSVYNGQKIFLFLLKPVSLRVPTRNLTDFFFFCFNIGYERRNCPSGRCASTASNTCGAILAYSVKVDLA